ncbi:hypothetical protein GGP87_002389 [Salinibacter ruber]|nr:hypothetical protein [Salinibacter ruber]MCS4050578.1 hypothetical protein [Salinibacter ruber]
MAGGGLLLGGRRNLVGLRLHLLDRGDDLAKRLARLLRQLDALLGVATAPLGRLHGLVDLRLHLADDVGDLGGRLVGLVGKLPHLLGHHGEPLARLGAGAVPAGSGRLNRRVQRQQIGLVRNLVDGLNNLADFFTGGLEAVNGVGGALHFPGNVLHLAGRLRDHLLPLARLPAPVLGGLGHGLDAARIFVDRLVQLLHRRGHLLGLRGLLLGTGGHLVGRRANLVGGPVGPARRAHHLLQGRPDRRDRALQFRAELAGHFGGLLRVLIRGRRGLAGERHGQVAVFEPFEAAVQVLNLQAKEAVHLFGRLRKTRRLFFLLLGLLLRLLEIGEERLELLVLRLVFELGPGPVSLCPDRLQAPERQEADLEDDPGGMLRRHPGGRIGHPKHRHRSNNATDKVVDGRHDACSD